MGLTKSPDGGDHDTKAAPLAIIFTLPVILGCALLGATEARADYILTIDQVPNPSASSGFDVVATGSGAFNTAGLTLLGSNLTLNANIQANIAQVFTGSSSLLTPAVNLQVTRYLNAGSPGNPTNIGPGNPPGTSLFASSVGGDSGVGINGQARQVFLPRTGNPGVPYVSGIFVTSTATWTNATIASLGMEEYTSRCADIIATDDPWQP